MQQTQLLPLLDGNPAARSWKIVLKKVLCLILKRKLEKRTAESPAARATEAQHPGHRTVGSALLSVHLAVVVVPSMLVVKEADVEQAAMFQSRHSKSIQKKDEKQTHLSITPVPEIPERFARIRRRPTQLRWDSAGAIEGDLKFQWRYTSERCDFGKTYGLSSCDGDESQKNKSGLHFCLFDKLPLLSPFLCERFFQNIAVFP